MTTRPFELDPSIGVGADRERLVEAGSRFVGTEVVDPTSRAFDEAYGALEAYFGHKNEIERRQVLEGWVGGPLLAPRLSVDYHLLAWHERATGALAGVRDAFVGLDHDRRLCAVLLSHSLVMPPFRRSGVAALIRTAPTELARRDLARNGLPAGTPTVLVAEMEPCVPSDRSSIVRLLSYGRSGYGVIPPSVLPYCQPDFRDLAALGVPAEPIPMPCVVRWIGHEGEGRLPTELADAMVRILAALHLRACEPTHVLALERDDRSALARHAAATASSPDAGFVPVLPLPTVPAEIGRLEPLLRSRALAHYPERYRTAMPDPDQDLAALLEAGELMEDR